jgi:hypothetical protein
LPVVDALLRSFNTACNADLSGGQPMWSKELATKLAWITEWPDSCQRSAIILEELGGEPGLPKVPSFALSDIFRIQSPPEVNIRLNLPAREKEGRTSQKSLYLRFET